MFVFIIVRPPTATLFPYTTLFRSRRSPGVFAAFSRLSRARHVRPLWSAANVCRREPRPEGAGRRGRTRLAGIAQDRKSTRLNSSHLGISYAVFCLKKKRNNIDKNQ